MMNPAVLLMAYGAASGPEKVSAFLRDVRGGRPASPQLVAEIGERYRLIGGSPLLEITRRQAAGLEARLGLRVYAGMRHSGPTIDEAVQAIQREGHREVVSLALTPYYSKLSVGAYQAKLEDAVRRAQPALTLVHIDSWNDQPSLISAWVVRIRAALARLPHGLLAQAKIIFSAHSLPQRILKEGDPYPSELAETIALVAAALRLKPQAWEFAYQSQGRTAEPWLGPDVAESLERLAAAGGRAAVLVPIGFISDHMETLYDDDILYREQACARGLHFERAASLNDDPLLIEAMAEAIKARLAQRPTVSAARRA